MEALTCQSALQLGAPPLLLAKLRVDLDHGCREIGGSMGGLHGGCRVDLDHGCREVDLTAADAGRTLALAAALTLAAALALAAALGPCSSLSARERADRVRASPRHQLELKLLGRVHGSVKLATQRRLAHHPDGLVGGALATPAVDATAVATFASASASAFATASAFASAGQAAG
jgi:hypothetical protein